MSDICGRRRLAKLAFVTGASGNLRGFLEDPKDIDKPSDFRLTDPFAFHAAFLEVVPHESIDGVSASGDSFHSGFTQKAGISSSVSRSKYLNRDGVKEFVKNSKELQQWNDDMSTFVNRLMETQTAEDDLENRVAKVEVVKMKNGIEVYAITNLDGNTLFFRGSSNNVKSLQSFLSWFEGDEAKEWFTGFAFTSEHTLGPFFGELKNCLEDPENFKVEELIACLIESEKKKELSAEGKEEGIIPRGLSGPGPHWQANPKFNIPETCDKRAGVTVYLHYDLTPSLTGTPERVEYEIVNCNDNSTAFLDGGEIVTSLGEFVGWFLDSTESAKWYMNGR